MLKAVIDPPLILNVPALPTFCPMRKAPPMPNDPPVCWYEPRPPLKSPSYTDPLTFTTPVFDSEKVPVPMWPIMRSLDVASVPPFCV